MGYNINLFHKDVREMVEAGQDFEDLKYPVLDKKSVADFIEGLKSYDYELESESPHQEFVKDVDGCPISVRIFETMIGFSIPYWENSKEAIFDALMDAGELVDSDSMAIYDPQSGEWS